MSARNLSLVAVGIILLAALTVGFLVSRPALWVRNRNIPVFAGEEITVKAVTAIKSKTALKVERAVKAVKAKTMPVLEPKLATPLPIFPPKIFYRVLPEYPVSALEQGLEGTTLLSIYIGAAGKPEKVEIKSSSGVAELDQSAVAAVSEWKFNPASQGGAAIASWFEIPVRFEVK